MVTKILEGSQAIGMSDARLQDIGARFHLVSSKLAYLNGIDEWVDQGESITTMLPSNTRIEARRGWEILMSMDEHLLASLMVIALLAYNVLRSLLTYFVSGLRDVSERSHVAPAYDEYRWLWRFHQIAAPLGILSVLAGTIRIVNALGTEVLVLR